MKTASSKSVMAKPTTNNKTVLILDGNELSTLAIVRSLGRQNNHITVAAVEKNARCRYSKYTHDFFTYPCPLKNKNDFLHTIIEKIITNSYHLILPVTELTTLPLAKIRNQINPYSLLALPDKQALEWATNKTKTFKLAKTLGIACPKNYPIIDKQALEQCLPLIQYPAVIKPSHSIVEPPNQARCKLKVDYAYNASELRKKGLKLLLQSAFLIQSYFSGKAVGMGILADHGEIIHLFQHQRLHELPLTGGGSCLRKGVKLTPILVQYSKKLIKASAWHGVAMLEFKYNESTQQGCLIEMNGRFWGSLPLACASGADFPWYLQQLLLHNQRPTQLSASTGHISRKAKDDCYWFIQVLFKRNHSPLIIWPTKTQLLQDLLSLFHYKHHFDSFSWRDMLPGCIELWRTFSWLYRFVKNFLHKYWLTQKQAKIRTKQSLRKPLKKATKLLILCYGNINRSAIAEIIFQHHKNTYQIRSAGFHPTHHRPADENMVRIAKQYDLNLQHWSSSTLDHPMIIWADIIFVMEIQHMLTLNSRYPGIAHKIFLLGSCAVDSQYPLEIADPYLEENAVYQRCLLHIQHCILQICAESH